VEGPTGRGGRVDPHHSDRWRQGDTVWPDGDERRQQPIVLDGRSVGHRRSELVMRLDEVEEGGALERVL
jgi:hypothetical protein